MTISTTTSRVHYSGAGSAGPFAFPFRILTATDLQVIKTSAAGADTVLALTTHYTVIGAGDAAGGSITLTSALATGERLTIRRVVPVTQPSTFRNLSTYFPSSHEDAFDRLVMVDQTQQDSIDRTFRLAASLNPLDFSLALPRPVANQVLAWTAAGTGLENRSVSDSATTLPGAGRTVASLTAYLANNAQFNPRDYLVSGATEWGAAINAAITNARALYEAGISTGGDVVLPAGVYVVDVPVLVPAGRAIRLRGAGWTQTVIRARTAMTQVVKLGDTAENLTWFTLDNIGVDAAGIASYAIYGSRVDNCLFSRVRAVGGTVAGCSIGYGWSNNYIACHWANNSGDGFQFNSDYSTSNNAASFIGCTALLNGGLGYRLRSGFGVKFVGGTVEQNPKGGILVTRQVNALSIDGTYFEGNGATGYTFTTPALTVKANILLNGDTVETTIGKSFPSAGVEINGTFCSTAGVEDAHIWASAVNGLGLRNNTNTPAAGSPVPLLKIYGDPSRGEVAEVESSGNMGFATADIIITNLPTDGQSSLRRIRSSKVRQQNYAETDFLRWSLFSSGGGGTFRRSATSHRGQPTWEINTATGASHLFGFAIDLAAVPALASKTVMFGAFVTQTAGTIGAAVYANGNVSSNGTSAVTGERWIEAAVTLPASGVVNFAVFGNAMSGAESVRFSHVTLTEIGVNADAFHEAPHGRVWFGTAMPTAGTWVIGDRVENRSPAVGQPKGWRRITTGAGNVLNTDWVSEGAL